MADDFPQPTYIHSSAATLLLSESRTLRPSPVLLHAINLLIDELLWLSLDACADPGATEAERIKLAAAGKTEEEERKGTIVWPLTTERFKSAGVLKVLGNGVGKNAVLEAELAVREYLKIGGSEARKDPAIVQPTTTYRAKVEAVFSELRRWCDQLSPLGQRFKTPKTTYSTGTSLLETVLPILLSPSHLASLPSSALITPALALWTTSTLAFLSEYVLRGVARVVERDPTHNVAAPADLLVFAGEDEGGIWSAFEGMRVRAFVEREVLGASQHGEGIRSRKNTLTKVPKNRPSTSGSERNRSETSEGRPSLAASSGSASSTTPIISSTTSTVTAGPGAQTKVKGAAAAGLRRIGSLSKARGVVVGEGRMRSASNRSGKSVVSEEKDVIDAEAGDAFEELMLSGKTMKVSLTPGRLKTMESFDKDKGSTTLKLLPEFSPDVVSAGEAAAPDATGTDAYPFPSTPQPQPRRTRSGPRLVARSPLTTRTDDLSGLEEESEEAPEDDDDEGLDSEDERMGYRKKKRIVAPGKKEKKESLADILNSPPPWAEAEPDDPPFSNLVPAAASRSNSTGSLPFSPTASARSRAGPTTSTTPGRGAAMMLGRPGALEPQTETKRNDTRELAAFFAQGPPPGIAGSGHKVSASEGSLQDARESGVKAKRKGLKGMMSRLRSRDGEHSGEEERSKQVNGRGAGLYKQRSSPTLRGQSIDSTPAPAVPSLPAQHRPGMLKRPSSGGRHSPLKSAIPFGGSIGSRDDSPKQSPLLDPSNLSPPPASTPTPTGAATPTPADRRPISASSTSPRRKPVPVLDEATLHIVAAEAAAPLSPPRMREHSHCSTENDETASLETAPSRVERLSRTASSEPVSSPITSAHNVLLGLHTPPPSDTGLAALAAGVTAIPASAVAVAKEGAAPMTPPASPPRQEGSVAVKAEEEKGTVPSAEVGVPKLVWLRQKMAACTTVAECLALLDAAVAYSSNAASETATQTDDQFEAAGEDEAAVIGWLLGELPAPEWVADASDASSIAPSGASTGLTSPNPCKDDKDSVYDRPAAFEAPNTLADEATDARELSGHGQALVAVSA